MKAAEVTRRIPSTTAAIYKSAPQPHRDTMLAMREHILSVVPEADEVVSYGMPAFSVNGTVVAGIMAAKNHVGYYPLSGSVLHLFPKEMSRYSHTKSAVHVPVDRPLSRTFIKKLIHAKLKLLAE